jgi:hypothetical protein
LPEARKKSNWIWTSENNERIGFDKLTFFLIWLSGKQVKKNQGKDCQHKKHASDGYEKHIISKRPLNDHSCAVSGQTV